MQRDGASAEDGGIERSLLRSTLRSLLLPRRLVPILLLGAVLVIAQERFSSDPAAVWLGALMCLVFALVAPVSWRALFPPALDAPPTFAAPFGRLLVYGITGIGTVLLVGWALPLRLDIGPTFMTSDVSLWVSVALFWVGGYGLGRDIDMEGVLARERAKAQRLEAEAERAHLLAMRSHLDPHFLFNTLNAIAEWCREDGEVAEQATLRLSEMLRTVLSATRRPAWPLRKELELARTLLDLHRVRDPDRFSIELEGVASPPAVEVPPMILLPLVENAAKHGPNAGHRGPLRLRVAAERAHLVLEVDNPGRFRGERVDGEGLQQVRRRLVHAYGGAASLEVRAEGERTRARIEIPLDAEVPHANA
ncbi:MAG: histidine kinase [Myxococcales bacterium]|nr:histidine kinase [Myxococcales bacterium]MCB9714608.1 histidine kinase [Myxococcales bacterium]